MCQRGVSPLTAGITCSFGAGIAESAKSRGASRGKRDGTSSLAAADRQQSIAFWRSLSLNEEQISSGAPGTELVLCRLRLRGGSIRTEKQPAASRTEAALKADTLFWETLHNGEYDRIPQALDALTAVYLDNPNDAITAAHVGWLHIWRLSERSRLSSVPPTVTDDAVMARKYFQEAVTLNPSDGRYLGFLASATLAEGSIHKDEKLIRQGYYMLLDSIAAWPEFNLFTAGYVMSRHPAASPRFREGLEWQWRSLDECARERVDRRTPDFSKYMSFATTEGNKRVLLELLDRAAQPRRVFPEHG